MWIVSYLISGWLVSNVYTIGPLPNRDACEHVRVQVDSAFKPAISACIELQPAQAPTITPAYPPEPAH